MTLFDLSRPEYKFRLIGSAILLVLISMSVFAPLITRHDPYERTGRPFENPGREHILGCNDVGHDLFSELLYGGRVSLFIGIFAAFFSTAFATLTALTAGYLGGATDKVIMRIVDIFMAIPFLPLVIVLGVFMGPGLGTQIFVISLVMWVRPCRVLRSQVMKFRESGYVDASRAMGEKSSSIILRHILPELKPLIVPQFVGIAQSAIMIESALSFLGLGDPVLKSWGSILFFANTRAAFLTGAWTYWVLPPGIAIALTVLSFSLIGFSLGGRIGFSYSPFGSFLLKRKELPPLNTEARLSVKELEVVYNPGENAIRAVTDLSMDLEQNEIIGLVGESGCGKSTLAMSILCMLRAPAEIISGALYLDGEELLSAKEKRLVEIRGRKIAYIPQNAMNALNPVQSVKKQIVEAILLHQNISRQKAEAEVLRLLSLVKIPPDRAGAFSHELSGGMKQRVIIAIALANNPEVLIADEPTTGLDVLVQKSIVDLLVYLKEEMKLTILFITHDLPLVMGCADRLAVMYKGEIVDTGRVSDVYENPVHPHTKELFRNFPRLREDKKWKRETCPEENRTSLVLESVTKTFHSKRGILGRLLPPVYAVKGVSLRVMPGEVLGVIGGSGSGKTTLAKLIMGLVRLDKGEIFINGSSIRNKSKSELQDILKKMHLVFQDPYQSMRSTMKILDVVAEPMLIHGISNKKEIKGRVCSALEEVSLPSDDVFLDRIPAELSGGQRQRMAFARAIVMEPSFIIADEPTSMLDVSLRVDLLELMENLRSRHNVGFIFITHDLALARHFCDRLVVMEDGSLVEEGESDRIIDNPLHPYTRSLIEAAEEPEFLRVNNFVSV